MKRKQAVKSKIKTLRNRDGAAVNDDWSTPKRFYDELDAEFHFDFDPCPIRSKVDGLAIEWGRSNFVNPPYNRIDKPRFIRKALEESRKGNTSVLLIPAAVSTSDYHDIIKPNAEVRFPRGRIAFEGVNSKGERVTTKKGKHDSMLVIFRGAQSAPPPPQQTGATA